MARFTPVVFWTLGAATALQSARRRAVVARATRDDAGSSFAFAPALSLGKWETMQAKRVRLQIRYSVDEDEDALDYTKTFKRCKRILQDLYPDVHVEGVPQIKGDDGFRILVDGKLVYEKPKERSGVYLSVKTLAREVNRARRQRRPTTTYGSGREASNRTAADVPKYD
mmetsp:Transcript_20739/g.63831  ORF Transcript_20739/g.63831 Transcript_20739/m.63831 type:complete len:169 (+) Transcript_20739:936-1442(+)